MSGFQALEDLFGIGTAIRLAVFFGWPVLWLAGKLRWSLIAAKAATGGGFIDIAYGASGVGGASAAFPMLGPWDIGGWVIEHGVCAVKVVAFVLAG
jgi:hypothetical protein